MYPDGYMQAKSVLVGTEEPKDRLRAFVVAIFGGKAARFAEALGWQRAAVYKYLSGDRRPGHDFLKALSDIGVNPTWILTGEGEMFAANAAGDELRKRAPSQWSARTRAQNGDAKEVEDVPQMVGEGRLEYSRIKSRREEGETTPPAFWDVMETEGAEMYFPVGKVLIPLMLEPASAGAPMPAEDTIDKYVDVEAWLAPNPRATLIIRARGASMLYDMIDEGDYIFIDRSVALQPGLVIVASLGGEILVKRYELKNGVVWLMPANPKYKGIEVKNLRELKIWGVVRQVIHPLRVV